MSWDSFFDFLECLNPAKIITKLIIEKPPIEIVVAVVNIMIILGVLIFVIVDNPLHSESFVARITLLEGLTSLFACVVFIILTFWFCCMMIFAASKFSPEKQN